MGVSASANAKWNGAPVTKNLRAGAARGVNRAMIRLQGHSVERAPVDAGDLRGSASVVEASEGDANPTAVLTFDEPYAAVQHEESFNHTAGAHGEPAGEDHYVTKNISEHGAEYLAIVGKDVRDALGS